MQLLLDPNPDGVDVLLGNRFCEGGALDLHDLIKLYHQRLLLFPILLPEYPEVPQLSGLEQALDILWLQLDDDALALKPVHLVRWSWLNRGMVTSRF